jgi:hypothetical protein
MPYIIDMKLRGDNGMVQEARQREYLEGNCSNEDGVGRDCDEYWSVIG